MSPVTYSAQDLLGMKSLPQKREVYEGICQKLQRDLSLEDILRFPVNRSLPLIVEEDTEKITPDSSNGSGPVQQLDGTDSEWRYRGRTENECGDPQPISAPPGLVAQKDEGFQRFYKAVVSPTHVRVTAGGRIVPNTRASSSPTSKWAKEKPAAPSLFGSRSGDRDPVDPSTMNGAQYPFAPYPSPYPGYAPAMHGSAYPMFPWHMYNTFCLPATMATVAASKANSKDNSRHQQDGVDDRQDVTDPRTHLFPSPADPARAMYFNGQWAMSPGPSFFAYGMPPMSAYPHPSMGTSMVAPTNGPTPAPAVPTVQTKTSDKTSLEEPAKTSPVAAESPTTQTTASMPNPPISSIRPSEITKKQIDVLRGSLKYLEDQLLYNKHQIDEKWMEYQAHMVRQQVEQFEKNLENQKSFEESHYPKSKENSSTSSASLPAQGPSVDEPAAQKSTYSARDSGSHSGSRAMREKDRDYHSNQGINSTKSVSLFAPKKLGGAALTITDPTKKGSKLPVNAALAPPFQPQNEQPIRSALRNAGHDTPYLVGTLPTGSNADKARETGYQYVRDLTDDELRARHMYWGKAPQHLQRGLPKFDGKDFYPPSPTRDRSSEAADSFTEIQTESGSTRSTTGSVYDPFRSLGRPRQRMPRGYLGQTTQSEALHRSEARNSSCNSSILERGTSCTGKIGRNYEDFRKVMDAKPTVPSVSPKVHSDSEDGEDGQSVLFTGRKPNGANSAVIKSRNDIWQSMLNKGKSSGQAVPSTLSSATAQGVLPQYRGHATAYLTPAIANTTMPARTTNANAKAAENIDLTTTKSQEVVQPENMPPMTTDTNESMTPSSLHKYNPQGILSQ